jgi:hypothetical protein
MSFTVWHAGDPAERAEWLRAWSEWPEREVFAHPAYAELYETETDRALCAAWRDGASTVLFPLLARAIPLAARHCDLSTPYGYGGPFVWGETGDPGNLHRGHGQAGNPAEATPPSLPHVEAIRNPRPQLGAAPPSLPLQFWPAYERWTRELGAVSEFVRFNLFPEALLGSYPGEKVCRTMNVVRALDVSPEELWQDFDYKVRKNVKRARLSGIRIVHDPEGARIDDFLRIYRGTMARRHASGTYDFPAEFFRRIQSHLPGCHTWFHAVLEGVTIATELVLLSPHRAYSFLGGTDERYFAQRPNDLLKVAIIEWCRDTGRRAFVLGGGYEPSDGIFRYKLSFAPHGQREFHIGKRILDQDAYAALIASRRGADPGWQPHPGYFPAYRA